METRLRVISVRVVTLTATLLLGPELRADADSTQIPMTLKAPVTFGLWTEADKDGLDKQRRVMKREAPRPGRFGSLILYDAPGPGYYRQLDQFDALNVGQQK